MRRGAGHLAVMAILAVLTLEHQMADAGPSIMRQAVGEGPGRRYGMGMSYDADREVVVLFGGGSPDIGSFHDTWAWDGTTWTRQTPDVVPERRVGTGMAFDHDRSEILMFGGLSVRQGKLRTLGDTWIWDGAEWVSINPPTSPGRRRFHSMASLGSGGAVILFGGQVDNFGNYRRDTWIWGGATWTRYRPDPSPTRRAAASIAFDEVRGEVVLFGGVDEAAPPFDDTWTWDGGTWAMEQPIHSPQPRSGASMAYDAARGEVVLFGGWDQDWTYFRDTWVWDGVDWERKRPAVNPGPRQFAAMAYDAARGEVVLFGGVGNPSGVETQALDDTWTWNGSTWTERVSP